MLLELVIVFIVVAVVFRSTLVACVRCVFVSLSLLPICFLSNKQLGLSFRLMELLKQPPNETNSQERDNKAIMSLSNRSMSFRLSVFC